MLIAGKTAVSGQTTQQFRKVSPTSVETLVGEGRLVLDFYGKDIVRIFYDPNGGNLRNPEANPPAQILVDNPRRNVGEMIVDGKKVRCGDMEIEVNGLDLVVNGRNMTINVEKSASLAIDIDEKEHFYGGGCQNGRFSHKGESIDIVNTNNWVDGGVASPEPFFWSTGGYGLMWYSFAPGKYDFGKSDATKAIISHETDYVDAFLMVHSTNSGQSKTMAEEMLGHYYQLTGNPILLPKFAFYEGHLNAYNRDYWKETEKGGILFEDGKRYTESQKDNGGIKESLNGEKGNYQFSARAVIDRYLDNDFPLGWILPNDGYGAGYGQTGTLDGNVQNLKSLGDYARSRGVEIGLWTQSDLHPKEGVEPLLQRDIIKEVRDAGVRVLKTDVAWVGAGYSFGLNGVADVADVMPTYGNNARPFIISLDGWAGTQRYAGIWTGDQTGGNWEYIRFHIPTYIGSGLSGQPNITSDMDGIFGGGNLDVNVRDFQWKAFTPMQLNMDGWGLNPKYPQILGEEAAKINRWYLKLKSALLPYTYSIAYEATKGKPMMRAMMLEEENEYTLGKGTQYQFMYGPDILVAPIYKESKKDGIDIRDGIYLPNGEWIDAFTGYIYRGGKIINGFAAPLWKLPIFIKRGAIIPFHKPTNNPSETDSHLRCYAIYPYGESEFTEYDDDGVTISYLTGNCVKTKISSSLVKDRLKITVYGAETDGNTDFFESMKSTLLTVQCSKEPDKVKVKGRKMKKVSSYSEWLATDDTYYYGVSDDAYLTTPMLMIHIGETDVVKSNIIIDIKAVEIAQTDHLLKKSGPLSAPESESGNSTAYSVTPVWKDVENADYYEIMYDGQIYSTIFDHQFTFEDLQPDSEYQFRLRSVNKDGKSEWKDISMRTAEDPLKDAVKGMVGWTSCKNQPGSEISCLLDFDESTMWHTDWNAKAVPFELVVDMKSVNQLYKLQYLPRLNAGNGTLLNGTVETSMDRNQWVDQGRFDWERSAKMKEMSLSGSARYMKIKVEKAVGDFGSGQQLYIYRQPDSEWYIQGDINQDGKLDENDLTSYMNYTGLRRGDSDFEGYISKGDINGNGLIDAFDICEVVKGQEPSVNSQQSTVNDQPSINITADRQRYNQNDIITLTVKGKDISDIMGLSFCIPYDTKELEYIGEEATGLAGMLDMTRDRLHSNGKKALYPTFVENLTNGQQSIDENNELMKIRFKAKKQMKYVPKWSDVIIVTK